MPNTKPSCPLKPAGTRLDKAIEAMAADSEYTPVVHRLGCLRGIGTLTAFGLAVEIEDWNRLTVTFSGRCTERSTKTQRRLDSRRPALWVNQRGATHSYGRRRGS